MLGKTNECPSGFETVDSKCYFYSNDQLSWDDAKESCKGKGATLMVPSNDKEYDFIKNRNYHSWIGANDKVKGSFINISFLAI